MATDNFSRRQPCMPRNFVEIGGKFVFVADRNFDNQLLTGTRACRLQSLQRAFDTRAEFVERPGLRRIIKNSDRGVGRHEIEHATNLRDLELSRRSENRIERLLSLES